eukprot:scaffold7785_cov27-Tisochrysis_lutea.AAC.1
MVGRGYFSWHRGSPSAVCSCIKLPPSYFYSKFSPDCDSNGKQHLFRTTKRNRRASSLIAIVVFKP